jgi:hypothetical protein
MDGDDVAAGGGDAGTLDGEGDGPPAHAAIIAPSATLSAIARDGERRPRRGGGSVSRPPDEPAASKGRGPRRTTSGSGRTRHSRRRGHRGCRRRAAP